MSKEVSIEQAILADNACAAQENRDRFARARVHVVNLMSGAGAGKTSLLERTIDTLKERLRIAVIAADLETRRDADRIARHEVPVVQINTKGACHVEAHQIARVASDFDLERLDLILIENVGNLVCPAEFELGETDKIMILSTTEGHDKPAKYPLMFKESRALVLNKIDLLPFTNFDLNAAIADARVLNPALEVFPLSVRSGEGLVVFTDWLEARVASTKRS
jgi:hydrogenase nickel incorporation protein HypB